MGCTDGAVGGEKGETMRQKGERCDGVCRTQAEAIRRAQALRQEEPGRRFWVTRAVDRWAVQSEAKEQASLVEEEE